MMDLGEKNLDEIDFEREILIRRIFMRGNSIRAISMKKKES